MPYPLCGSTCVLILFGLVLSRDLLATSCSLLAAFDGPFSPASTGQKQVVLAVSTAQKPANASKAFQVQSLTLSSPIL